MEASKNPVHFVETWLPWGFIGGLSGIVYKSHGDELPSQPSELAINACFESAIPAVSS